MAKPVKALPKILGVLGLGSIGLRHSKNLLGMGVQVVGFDPDESRRQLLAKAGGRPTSDRKDAFATDAIVIATPHVQHGADLAEAIEADRDVFIEKPLSHSEEGLDAILSDADARQRVVYMGFQLRHHPCVQAAERILLSGALGTILWGRFLYSGYLPSWRPHQDHRQGYAADPGTGGVILDVIHEIDLALHLLGPGETAAAQARSSGTIGIAAEDIAALIIRHENGPLSEIHLDFATRPARRTFEIAGCEGTLHADLIARRLRRMGNDGKVGEDETFPGSMDDDYIKEMKGFLDCVSGKSSPPCGGRQGLEVLRHALKARRLSGFVQA